MQTATEYAARFVRDDVVGIAFLGAIVRGYFDESSDIDIFTRGESRRDLPPQTQHVNGIELHCWVADYNAEAREKWDRGKRRAYSECRIFHDPQGLIRSLIREKVPLRPDEKRWLLLSGITLSEWYINRLPRGVETRPHNASSWETAEESTGTWVERASWRPFDCPSSGCRPWSPR
jgi:hypothetical protein